MSSSAAPAPILWMISSRPDAGWPGPRRSPIWGKLPGSIQVTMSPAGVERVVGRQRHAAPLEVGREIGHPAMIDIRIRRVSGPRPADRLWKFRCMSSCTSCLQIDAVPTKGADHVSVQNPRSIGTSSQRTRASRPVDGIVERGAAHLIAGRRPPDPASEFRPGPALPTPIAVNSAGHTILHTLTERQATLGDATLRASY